MSVGEASANGDRGDRGVLGAHGWIAIAGVQDVAEFLGPDTAEALTTAVDARLRRATDVELEIRRVDDEAWCVAFPSRVHPSAAARHLTQIVDQLSEPLDVRGILLFADPHAGLAAPPLDGTRPELLERRARSAMRQAVRTGTPVVRWGREITDEQRRRTRLLADFHRSLERDELTFHYQPKWSLSTGRVCGAEALVRWHHPELGLVRPDEFISLVEASALVRPFTRWAIARACRDWSRAREHVPDTRVAINLPIPALTDLGLAELVIDTIVDHGIDTRMLQVEMTERNVPGRESDLLAGIGLLTELGITVSLDDFGTGQSSLAYLRHLSLSEVKIDKAFVTSIDADPVNQAIVDACVRIAGTLGISVCAEGIETASELETIRALGCGTAQGYLLGRPSPLDDLLATVADDPVAAGGTARAG